MKIHLNGETVITQHRDLATLVAALGHDADKVATAVDGFFVARQARAETALKENCSIDVLAPMEGG